MTQVMRGEQEEGYTGGTLVAGYTHLYFPSQPQLAHRFVEAARVFGAVREYVQEFVETISERKFAQF